MKREAGGQGEFSVGRIFGAATPPGALVHVKKVTVLNVKDRVLVLVLMGLLISPNSRKNHKS